MTTTIAYLDESSPETGNDALRLPRRERSVAPSRRTVERYSRMLQELRDLVRQVKATCDTTR